MNEQEWLLSSNPADMLDHLTHEFVHAAGVHGVRVPREKPMATDRKLQLFACACLELTDRKPALTADYGIEGEKIKDPYFLAKSWASRNLPIDSLTDTKKALLLRLIFGNPFRPVEPGFCAANHEGLGNIYDLAQTCYDLRDPAYFGRIWDALETASCDSEEIRRALAWKQRCGKCLGEGAHGGGSEGLGIIGCLPCDCIGWLPIPGEPVMVRGFWVIDLILGKE